MVLTLAYRNDAISATTNPPPTLMPGIHAATSRNATAWKISTSRPVTTSESGATSTSTMVRTTALNSDMAITAATASRRLATVSQGSIHALTTSDTAATSMVTTKRQISASGP